MWSAIRAKEWTFELSIECLSIDDATYAASQSSSSLQFWPAAKTHKFFFSVCPFHGIFPVLLESQSFGTVNSHLDYTHHCNLAKQWKQMMTKWEFW